MIIELLYNIGLSNQETLESTESQNYLRQCSQ